MRRQRQLTKLRNVMPKLSSAVISLLGVLKLGKKTYYFIYTVLMSFAITEDDQVAKEALDDILFTATTTAKATTATTNTTTATTYNTGRNTEVLTFQCRHLDWLV